jgi:hypothetical protein
VERDDIGTLQEGVKHYEHPEMEKLLDLTSARAAGLLRTITNVFPSGDTP